MRAFLKKIFSILFRIMVAIVKIFICLGITLFVGYFATIASVITSVNSQGFDWKILLYIIISAYIVLGIWLIALIKTKKNAKIIYAVIFFIWFFSPRIFHFITRQFDYDICTDIGICAEGLRFADGVMNKEYCLKEGKEWDDKEKVCDMRIEMRTCEKQGYKWIYTEDKCSHKIIKDW